MLKLLIYQSTIYNLSLFIIIYQSSTYLPLLEYMRHGGESRASVYLCWIFLPSSSMQHVEDPQCRQGTWTPTLRAHGEWVAELGWTLALSCLKCLSLPPCLPSPLSWWTWTPSSVMPTQWHGLGKGRSAMRRVIWRSLPELHNCVS